MDTLLKTNVSNTFMIVDLHKHALILSAVLPVVAHLDSDVTDYQHASIMTNVSLRFMHVIYILIVLIPLVLIHVNVIMGMKVMVSNVKILTSVKAKTSVENLKNV